MGDHTDEACNAQSKLNITPKELSLLKDLVKGHQDKQMAYTHEIPLHMVKYHLRTLYEKLGVRNRTQAALIAREIIL